MELEGNMLSIIAMQYRKSLNELFEQIEKCNDNNIVPASNMAPQPNMGSQPGMAPQPNMGPQPFNASQAAQSFRESNLSRQETLCEIGFWLSIVGAILPFFGIAYGLFIYIMNFYFAAQGMSTRKKPKAIITIILSCLSIVMVIIGVIMMINERSSSTFF